METRSSVGPWRAASMALGVFLLLCIASGRVDAQAPATEEDYPVMYEEWEAKVERARSREGTLSFSRWEIYAPTHDRVRVCLPSVLSTLVVPSDEKQQQPRSSLTLCVPLSALSFLASGALRAHVGSSGQHRGPGPGLQVQNREEHYIPDGILLDGELDAVRAGLLGKRRPRKEHHGASEVHPGGERGRSPSSPDVRGILCEAWEHDVKIYDSREDKNKTYTLTHHFARSDWNVIEEFSHDGQEREQPSPAAQARRRPQGRPPASWTRGISWV